MRRGCTVLLCLALILFGAGVAAAHAWLDYADPPVGGAVRTSPPEVRIRFTQELNPASCTIRVLDSSGRRVDRDDAQIDSSDPAILRVTLSPLSAGRYKVIWRVRSSGSHVTEGDFYFHVAP